MPLRRVIDGSGVAIYVADITYRSEVIRLHIDLLAHSNSLPLGHCDGAGRRTGGRPK
jgi:hypothetical protein